MTARDTLPADPELLAARPPNPAVGAAADVVIGVLCPGGRVIETPDGTRLVLTRETTVPAPLECFEEGPNGQCDQDARADHWCTRKGNRLDPDEGDRFTEGVAAAPALLDPGNPEQAVTDFASLLWKWEQTITDDERKLYDLIRAARLAARNLEGYIARTARERAEAEQDASDRKLAHKVAAATKQDFTLLAESYQEEIQRHVLAGIRAGRAERQEVGQ